MFLEKRFNLYFKSKFTFTYQKNLLTFKYHLCNNYKGDIIMKELEMKELVEKSEKLAKINDLWYFVKSKGGAWIAGSGK